MSVQAARAASQVLGAERARIAAFIPKLSYSQHKGQSGKIGVIGGCFEYTGAPYFAAISALHIGADLSHVFCAREAATAIKSYSPEIIVHPCLECVGSYVLISALYASPSAPIDEAALKASVNEVEAWLSRLSCLVVGPGLGRDPFMIEAAIRIMRSAKTKGLPLVVDGDGLHAVMLAPDAVKGHPLAILTPNLNEYGRLVDAHTTQAGKATDGHNEVQIGILKELCSSLGNVTIVKKGAVDLISNGTQVVECNVPGSVRRCGGQGDILAAAVGTFLSWSSNPESILLAALGGCSLCRTASVSAYLQHGRSMTTTMMIPELGPCFKELWD